MKFKAVFPFICCVFLAGCVNTGEESVNLLLEQDPSFKKIYTAKLRIDKETENLRNEYSREEEDARLKIATTKQDLAEKRNAINTKVASLRQEMEPVITSLEARLKKERFEYSDKKTALKDAKIKLKNIQRLLAKKGELSLSSDEISVWNKRVSELEKETASLDAELTGLRNRIRITKTELAILKR